MLTGTPQELQPLWVLIEPHLSPSWALGVLLLVPSPSTGRTRSDLAGQRAYDHTTSQHTRRESSRRAPETSAHRLARDATVAARPA